MDRILFGDNQFFGINHISESKARAIAIKFKNDKSIIDTIDIARETNINTLMCTTHDRIKNICDIIRNDQTKYQDFTIYPCMPYAHKYANAITEHGIIGTINEYVPGNLLGSFLKGGMAFVSKDYLSIMELMIDAEMKMFKNINTPVIFLQNVITDLLLGLGMKDILKAYHDYIKKKYNTEAGFITMNLPALIKVLNEIGIYNPIICSSINKAGFRMSGGIQQYHKTISNNKMRLIAMQIFGGGAIPAKEAIEYICSIQNITSILFGASSKQHISQTVNYINEYDQIYHNEFDLVF